MRVALLTTSFPRSPDDDAGIFVGRMVDGLAGTGVKGAVFVPKDAEETFQRSTQFPTHRFGYTLFCKRTLAFGAGIVPNIRRRRSAILQAPGLLFGFVRSVVTCGERFSIIHANWLVTAIPGAILSVLLGIPLVVTARGEDIRLLRKRIFRVLLKGFLLRAKVIVAVGESSCKEIAELLPQLSRRITVVENGVEPVRLTSEQLHYVKERYGLVSDRTYIVALGSVIPRKHVRETIKAFAALSSQPELLLCGRLDDQEYVSSCQELCRQLGVEDRVRFLGSVSPEDVWGILQCATIYISSSESEGRPNAMLEALAMGVPVVASAIPAHEQLSRVSGAVALFRSTEEATAHLTELLRDPEKRKRMAVQGAASQKNASWSDVASQYLRVYQTASPS